MVLQTTHYYDAFHCATMTTILISYNSQFKSGKEKAITAFASFQILKRKSQCDKVHKNQVNYFHFSSALVSSVSQKLDSREG